MIRLRAVAAVVVAAVATTAIDARADPRADRLEDFDAFCRFVADDYAYFDLKRTDWPAACAAWRPAAADAPDRGAFVEVVGRALGELYDPHAHTGTSTPRSPRLVPTDSDLDAEWHGADAVVVAVRADSHASTAGLRAGMKVISVDGRPIAEAVDTIAPLHLKAADPAARDWALRVALAGHQDRQPVELVVEDGGGRRRHAFVPGLDRPEGPLSTRRVGRVAVVRFNNSLGDLATVAAFDTALDAAMDAGALVLDLRDTPSGGNTAVARGIMSRLVAREAPYQRHERIGEVRATGIRQVWVELLEPRGRTFEGLVVVLVGRWTGSMGEGIAIGLDAARGAPVIGAPMAGLLGALDELRLPHADFVVRIPAEKLSHVDGTPRESFVPCAIAPSVDDEAVEASRIGTALASGAMTTGPRHCPQQR